MAEPKPVWSVNGLLQLALPVHSHHLFSSHGLFLHLFFLPLSLSLLSLPQLSLTLSPLSLAHFVTFLGGLHAGSQTHSLHSLLTSTFKAPGLRADTLQMQSTSSNTLQLALRWYACVFFAPKSQDYEKQEMGGGPVYLQLHSRGVTLV